jgi:hypothetical protein
MDDRRRPALLLSLAAIHAVLAGAYLVTPSIPLLFGRPAISIPHLISLALSSVSHPPWMLLVFWCAMGTSRTSIRVLGGLTGVIYSAALNLVLVWQIHRLIATAKRGGINLQVSTPDYFETFVRSAALACVLYSIWLVPLLVYRYRHATLSRSESNELSPPRRGQLNLASLFILTLIVACYMALGRLVQRASVPNGFGLLGIAHQGLYLLTYGLVGFFGLRAALLPGAWQGRVVGTLVLVVLPLGLAYAGCTSSGGIDWSDAEALLHVFMWSLIAVGLPSIAYLASLLVVRACGYRLVAHREVALNQVD